MTKIEELVQALKEQRIIIERDKKQAEIERLDLIYKKVQDIEEKLVETFKPLFELRKTGSSSIGIGSIKKEDNKFLPIYLSNTRFGFMVDVRDGDSHFMCDYRNAFTFYCNCEEGDKKEYLISYGKDVLKMLRTIEEHTNDLMIQFFEREIERNKEQQEKLDKIKNEG